MWYFIVEINRVLSVKRFLSSNDSTKILGKTRLIPLQIMVNLFIPWQRDDDMKLPRCLQKIKSLKEMTVFYMNSSITSIYWKIKYKLFDLKNADKVKI